MPTEKYSLEREAAIRILRFMQKHEIEDEEMIEIITATSILEEDKAFWDHFGGIEMDHIRRIANGEY
jgi:hypothetical protein